MKRLAEIHAELQLKFLELTKERDDLKFINQEQNEQIEGLKKIAKRLSEQRDVAREQIVRLDLIKELRDQNTELRDQLERKIESFCDEMSEVTKERAQLKNLLKKWLSASAGSQMDFCILESAADETRAILSRHA